MMAGVATVCEGRRFQASALDYRFGGLNIAEVLDQSVEDAVGFFNAGEARTPAAHAILKRMADVGLGYLRLGQPLTTLSGGERQRLKLGLLDRLVDSGKSVIVIEHHQAVMAHADWIIDLGPGAATTAGGSCSKAPRPTWWRRGRR
jgi:excinuclease UvrABC ATPase subunit